MRSSTGTYPPNSRRLASTASSVRAAVHAQQLRLLFWLYDLKDGTYHCDLRRYYLAVNAHFDAANGLLQGIQRFEETGPEPAVFF